MAKFAVKYPFRSHNVLNPSEKNRTRTKSEVAQRVRTYRLRIKSDPIKLREFRLKKKNANLKYRAKVLAARKADEKYNEMIKKKERVRKQKYRIKLRKQAEEKKKSKADKKVRSKATKKVLRSQSTANRRRKQVQRCKKTLPIDSEEWAETINHLVRNATPRRRSRLNLEDAIIRETADLTNTSGTDKGRPSKSRRTVKRHLANTPAAERIWSRKSLQQFHRRSKAQTTPSKTKVFQKSWKNKLDDFLESNSRPMPNKKDTILIDGKPVAKRHLLGSKLDLYKRFKKQNPSFDRRFVSFLKLIPKNYRHLNLTARRVCVCLKDYNIERKIESINNAARAHKMHNLVRNPRQLSNITLCDKPARSCVDRKCEKCGTGRVREFYAQLLDENKDQTVKYIQWVQVEVKYLAKDGTKKKTKRWIQKHFYATITELVQFITDDMKTFTSHIFRSDYQHCCERELMSESLPMSHCTVVMDYSENISLQPQDELEVCHWTLAQVTLHPMFLVRHAPDSTEDSPKLMKESLIVISDSLTHNSEAVYVFTGKLIAHLKANPGPCDIKTIHRFSDNSGVQYKNKDAFANIMQLEEIHNVKIIYHFTESGHGKGPSDGIGAAVKRRLDRLILSEKRVINNAYQVYLALSVLLGQCS